jgi:hypothetical protein
MVAHAESEIHKTWPALDLDRSEDHPEASCRWRQVDLRAVGQHRAVPAVLLYAPQVLQRDAAALIVPSGDFGCLATGGRAAREVFLPSLLIEVRGKAAPAGSAQRLRLVVGQEHVRLVLAPELGGLLGGHLPTA